MKTKIHYTVIILLAGCLLAGCKKEIDEFLREKLKAESYLKCTINGVDYIDQGKKIFPDYYHAPKVSFISRDGKNGSLDLFSRCYPENMKEELPYYYIDCKIFMELPLKIGERYRVSAMYDSNGEVCTDGRLYREQRHSYCKVTTGGNGEVEFYDGFIELTYADTIRKAYDGRIELRYTEGETVKTIVGQFHCVP